MNLRTRLCVALSKRLMKPPAQRTVDGEAYADWRHASLSRSFGAFEDAHVAGKDVLDFGCGAGPLSIWVARERAPRRVIGVDASAEAIRKAEAALAAAALKPGVVEFRLGTRERIPAEDASVDTLLAFDCLEHVMEPGPIMREWARVLRPGGRCLIEWFPFKGPWGPHMEALIPIPWAHVLFGERAMFRAAEAIYDSPAFTPRTWDLEPDGGKKPNKWRQWSTFKEQGYVNQLDLRTFRRLAAAAGFTIAREERHSFGGSWPRRAAGRALMAMPLIGESFVSYVIVELVKPA